MTDRINTREAIEPSRTGVGRPASSVWLVLTRRLPQLAALSIAAAVLPIIVAAMRAVANGWIPYGDDALFSIRARDVFTGHTPLLGTWTSASVNAGLDINNPGPLYYDLLAMPVRVFGTQHGTIIGVALVNCLAVIGIAVVAHRRGGAALVAAAMAVTAALTWSLGTQVLFTPIQPLSLVLPFLCVLMLAWTVSAADLMALPWLIGAGSLLLQTHVVYIFLVPFLVVWALVGLGLELRLQSRDHPWEPLRRRVGRISAVSAAVLAAAWIQPVVEQFTSDGPGNITRLLRAARQSTTVVGYERGAKLVATVVSLPPWWLRPSFKDAFLPSVSTSIPGTVPLDRVVLPSMWVAAGSLALVLGALVACAWVARQRHDRSVLRGATTGVVALVAAVWNAHRIPVGPLGLSQHVLRWIWPIGAFLVLVVVAAICRLWMRRPAAWGAAGATFALLAVVFAVPDLPTSVQTANSPEFSVSVAPVMRDLNRQLGALKTEGPLLFDIGGVQFGDFYSTAVWAELQRRGIPFVVSDHAWIRQLGPARRFNGRNARAVLSERVGSGALSTTPGARRVALHLGLSGEEQRTLGRLGAMIAGYLRERGPLELNQRGRRALHRVTFQVSDPNAALSELAEPIDRGYLRLDAEWERRFARALDLHHRWERGTVALFVTPLPRQTRQPDQPG